jgi:uncharacterized tellurite resistance protein B-like protein
MQMFTHSSKPSRGKALEEAFFYQMDQELIALLSQRLQRDEKIRAFASATGIRDKQRLASLVDAGFELSTLTAFIWVPLVFVAWADGNADEMERNAIFRVLTNKGISHETASMMIAHDWLRQTPREDLWKTWEEFTAVTLAKLVPTVRNEMIDEIVGLCHVVANASGGFLGVGTISETEARIIDRVTRSMQEWDVLDDQVHHSTV